MSRWPSWLPDRPHPFAGSTLPGRRQVGEGLSPTLDAVTFLIQNRWTVKENRNSMARSDPVTTNRFNALRR